MAGVFRMSGFGCAVPPNKTGAEPNDPTPNWSLPPDHYLANASL